MESRAFLELQYMAMSHYLNSLKIDKEVPLNWERKLPLGKSKYEHYRKAGLMLLDIIKENVDDQDAAIVIIPASFQPIIYFASEYAGAEECKLNGVYQCGILGNTAVAVDPTIPSGEEAYMLLIDFASGKTVKITQGKYDYDTDLAEEMAYLKEIGMLIPEQ